jgi:hypothetical protein
VDPDGRFPVTQEIAAWLNLQVSDAKSSIQHLNETEGSNAGSQGLSFVNGLSQGVVSAGSAAVGALDAGLDLVVSSTAGYVPGLRDTGIVQDTIRKTNARIETGGQVVHTGYDYATQDNLEQALKRDAQGAYNAVANYTGELLDGNLEATAGLGSFVGEAGTGVGLAAKVRKAKNAAKILDEAASGPKPNKDVPEWKSNSSGDYSPGNVAGDAPQVPNKLPVSVDPREIGFSQTTVSYRKTRMTESGEKITYTYDDLVAGMKADGWNGSPLNVVRMPDGSLTSIDNTRLLAAREANIDAQVVIHNYADEISNASALEYARPNMAAPKSWGEAIQSSN